MFLSISGYIVIASLVVLLIVLGGLKFSKSDHDPQRVCPRHQLPLSTTFRSHSRQLRENLAIQRSGALCPRCLHEECQSLLPEKVMASGKNGNDGDLLLFHDGPCVWDISAGTLRLFISWECSRPVAQIKVSSSSGHSLHFGRPKFALITGMRFGTIRFCSYTSADLKFRNRVFPHKVGLVVTILDVLGVIEDEVMFGNLCDEDSVRLCLILALEVIFMGRLFTCPVDDSLFGLVENLEAWNVFPWGEHVWTQLYDSIKNVVVKHSDTHYLGFKKDRNYVPTYTLTGFVFAFQIWILESFERSNRWWINAPQVIPRAIGWSKKSIFKRSDCCYLFAKDSKINTDIRPTRAEYESSCLREGSSVCTRDSRLKTRRLTDRVIRELNVHVFKLETIIQVLALERKDKLGVFIPINETDQHLCLAHLDILSGLVAFYDSGDTYDYE
ncbi:phospholipase-like protein [Tanacetum coccineum]